MGVARCVEIDILGPVANVRALAFSFGCGMAVACKLHDSRYKMQNAEKMDKSADDAGGLLILFLKHQVLCYRPP